MRSVVKWPALAVGFILAYLAIMSVLAISYAAEPFVQPVTVTKEQCSAHYKQVYKDLKQEVQAFRLPQEYEQAYLDEVARVVEEDWHYCIVHAEFIERIEK